MSVNTLKRSFDQISDLMETPIKANQTLNNNNTTLTMEANNVLEGSIYSTVDESTMQMEKLFMKAKKQKKVHVVEEKPKPSNVDEYLQSLLDQPRFNNHPAVLEQKDLADLVRTLEQQKATLQRQLEASIQELKSSGKGWHSFSKVESGVAVFQSPLIDGQGKFIALNNAFIEALGLDRTLLEGSFNSETMQAFLMASNRSFTTQEPGDGTICITLD